MRNKLLIFIAIMIILIVIIRSCINHLYHSIGSSFVNNGPHSIGSVEAKHHSYMVYKYVDSLYKYFPEYIVPNPWKISFDSKKENSKHLDLAFFYFKNNPEEIHELQFSGMIYHKSVSKIRNGKMYLMTGEGARNNNETERILSRIENEIFTKIDSLIDSDLKLE